MVLAHFGVPASLAEVVSADPPRDGGVRAGDLRDVARAKGLSAFVVAGTFADLFEQLGHGRPVLVGLAKPITGGARAGALRGRGGDRSPQITGC